MSETHRPVKRAYIRTFGCQMNVYDSERMADALRAAGYAPAATPETADLLLLNTCHIREKAVEKVYSELGRLRPLVDSGAREGRRVLVGVAGCVAQAEGEEIPRRQPLVDFVVGPQAYHQLPAIVARLERRESRREIVAEFPVEDKFDRLPRRRAARGPAAFVTVQEGCDKFCSFCVVPYTRGAEASRPVDAVLGEARELAASGVVEITLLGQNVNAYRGAGPGGRWNLAQLLRSLSEISGIRRLRYTTSHPRDMDDDLIAAHAEIESLMPYLHLPVQSGSDRILRAMNRGHSAKSYVSLIRRVRAARSDIAISGDFIVGFPGEDEADFRATLDIVDEIGYAQAFSFRYSARPGTPAALAPDQVDPAAASERLARLQERISRHNRAFAEQCVGQVLPVLLERSGRKTGQIDGKSPYLQSVHVFAPEALLGEIVPVRIERADSNSLAGRLSHT